MSYEQIISMKIYNIFSSNTANTHKNELKLCCYGQLVDIVIKTPNKNRQKYQKNTQNKIIASIRALLNYLYIKMCDIEKMNKILVLRVVYKL